MPPVAASSEAGMLHLSDTLFISLFFRVCCKDCWKGSMFSRGDLHSQPILGSSISPVRGCRAGSTLTSSHTSFGLGFRYA